MTDTEIKSKAIQILNTSLGTVETERFIALMNKEPFDYTEWQKTLFEGMSLREISSEAMKLQSSKDSFRPSP